MEFWIFVLVMDLFIPLIMIGFGRYFSKKAPKEINAVFGYRTSRSMKSKATWVFAHNYFGKLWYICGWILLPITILTMVLVMGEAEDMVGTVGELLCCVQMILLVSTIIPTERALKKTFDENGEER